MYTIFRSHVALILLLCSIFIVPGCALFKGTGGEPAVLEDAPPPPNYSPIFISRTAPFNPALTPKAVISRIETNNPSRVRAYVHLIDTTTGAYLTGAAAGKSKSIWCNVSDDFAGQNLQVKNFTLREVTENDREPHAIAIVMDHSGSMGEERAHAVQDAAARLIDRKKPEDGMALVKYDNAIVVESPLTTSGPELQSKLLRNGLTGFGGLTAVGDGTARGIDAIASNTSFSHKAVIVMTDGRDNSSSITADSLVRLARKNNVIICAVDFGYGVNEGYLQYISAATGGSYHRIYRTTELDDAFEDIYRRLHNYYLIEYEPVDYGIHTMRVKLCLGRDTVVAQGTYDNTPDIGAIALLNVQFDYDKSNLKGSSGRAIDNVLGMMKAYPTLAIELRGHTDASNNTGDPEYNLKLSQRRANAVRDELIRLGVEPGRIRAVGFGEKQPVADNATQEGKAKNRRTEFVIVSR